MAKKKETVIVFDGEADFLVPRNRTYDMETGMSAYVGGDGTSEPCFIYVITVVPATGNQSAVGGWQGNLCDSGAATGSKIAPGATITTPCIVGSSLRLTNATVIETLPCGGGVTSTTTTTVIPVTSSTTTSTSTSTTTVSTGTMVTSTMATVPSLGVPPPMGGGGIRGGGGGGGGGAEEPEAKKKFNWLPLLLIGGGLIYLFTRKKK